MWPVWLLANLLILGVIAYAAQIESAESDTYYRLVQEDEALEWATFWAFFLAAALFGKRAREQHREGIRLPWFYIGLSLFCFLVAMEEISWGQRVFGFRPPDYFLANNFQQELNIHNVLSTDLRKLVLKAVILGYGVVLAILAQIPVVASWLRRFRISAPPIFLVPSFLGIYVLYEEYPWGHTGEWVEYVLGLGFLFVALLVVRERESAKRTSSLLWRPMVSLALFWVAVLGLGVGTAAWSRRTSEARPELVQIARLELDALHQDYRSGNLRSRCGRHKRLYAFIEKYGQDEMFSGEFSRLTERGLPAERAQYFLDPWNSPYWIRDRCKDDHRKVFIYSFGPNRRRESSKKEILGDDVGTENLELGG
jgi:hypothetical protein